MGHLFKVPAFLVCLLSGLSGAALPLGIVVDGLGLVGGMIPITVLPITLALAPLYVAIAHGNLFPLLLIWGGQLGAGVLYSIGAAIDG